MRLIVKLIVPRQVRGFVARFASPVRTGIRGARAVAIVGVTRPQQTQRFRVVAPIAVPAAGSAETSEQHLLGLPSNPVTVRVRQYAG
ncbi:hypothetical protein [Bradyrhizobium sp. 1]|uniref:hypothetical protein n=1 Tax=Bradyrhizobium sp. 1 TaxID=241591 RepID=UPI001FF72DAB|nr:hypothetical protein [Bradyrhizobium sp. 1]MCK1394563.1 hypothetical protein [Bradyrhizobium sp. 1]